MKKLLNRINKNKIIQMKNTVIKIAMLCLITVQYVTSYAQQEPQYTQFMYNKLPINAAYTGARDVLSIRALYRNQWSGIKGAPQTTSLSLHSPFKRESNAMGMYIVNDRLGVTNQTWFNVTYAYRISLPKKMKLSIGLNAGILWYKSNLQDLVLNSNIDPFIANVNRVLPDVGAGIYLTHDYFYVGVSVPNFIKSSLYNKSTINNISASNASKVNFAHRTPHFFFMAGGVIPAGKVLKVRPQILGKYIVADQGKKIPFQMDFNLSLLIYNRVNIGGTYRTAFHNKKTGLTNGDSFDVMLEVWPLKQFMIGYAYDYTLTKLGDYNKGSHEIILGYDFVYDKKKINTPRYF